MSKTLLNRLLLAVVLLNLCAIIGCHRGYYRRQADAEARRLIREKSVDPRWNTSNGEITVDPLSRMFDPFSADHPPIPPDDPSSHQFMHTVDGKEGYPHWHANGDTNAVENPDWRASLPVNEKGQVVLTLERAFQLALMHSPEYQEQRENLYLSALDVSLDRFGFDTQLFAGFNDFFTTQGRFRGPGGRSVSEYRHQLGANGGGINFEKLGITGANFAVGLANTILFNFAGPDTQSATSLIDFSLIQPLLRGAGRDRIMESLTQSERTLLANVRQIERFRRGFYLLIAVGRNAGAGPNRVGNFLGTPNAPSSSAGGYFGLLEQQQRIRNQELNVRQLEAVLELFREFFLRERLDAVQLKQFETSVYRQQRTLLDLKTSYQTSLDRFKLTLGLPPDIDVVIDDSYLDRFELISDQVNERLISIGELREETGAALNRIDDLFDELRSLEQLEKGEFDWPREVNQRIEDLVPFIDRAEKTLEKIANEDRSQLESDFRKLDSIRSERLKYLESLQAAIDSGEIISDVDPGLFRSDSIPEVAGLRRELADPDSVDSIDNRMATLRRELAQIRGRISDFPRMESQLDRKSTYQFILNEFQEKIPGQLSEMNNLMLELSLLQAQARSNSIEVADVEIKAHEAIEIARCMRRDWMNARASLVDQWRNIEFVADQLESQLDLVFQGDIGNVGDNPLKLRYETGQLRAGFRIDAPVVRLSERNQYREALIDYQQSKRQFYRFEDNVKRILREIVRDMNRNKVLFELDRRTVQVEIENVEINRYELEKPVGPNANNSRLGATTAQNLTNAIIGLNGAQNSFLRSWVEYEVLRRNLDFDMGTMQLDATGAWIDPGQIDAGIGYRAASMMGIELDCQFCEGAALPLTGTATELPGAMFDQPAPSQLPFETQPPVEVDGNLVPESPRLNRPESGMRNQKPRGGAPNLLFPQVNVQSAPDNDFASTNPANSNASKQIPDSTPTERDTAEDQITSQSDQLGSLDASNRKPATPTAIEASPIADEVHKISLDDFAWPTISPASRFLESELTTSPPNIAASIADSSPAPESQPMDEDVALASGSMERAAANHAQMASLETAIQSVRNGTPRPEPEFTLIANPDVSRKSQDQTQTAEPPEKRLPTWQSRKSTLGEVLRRFRTEPDAK